MTQLVPVQRCDHVAKRDLRNNFAKDAKIILACEHRRISGCHLVLPKITSAEPGNDLCDVEILSQSQFSSSDPRTTARGIRASHERKLQTTMAGDVVAVLSINFAMFWVQNSHLAPEKRSELHF